MVVINPRLEVRDFDRVSFTVQAVQVTSENMDAVAKWCGGDVKTSPKPDHDTVEGHVPEKFVKVRVYRPMGERQTMAFVGDWVLYAGKGYKVYTNIAFEKSFKPSPVEEVDPVSSRSAISGQFVTPEFAEANPDTTVTES